MPFCGDLPFVPSGINHHPFENLRRKGHHCHGRKRLSGGRPQKFLPAFGQKLLWDVHFPPGLAETVVAVCAPGDRGLNRCMAPDTTTGRTRRNDEERVRETALPLTSRRPFAGMPGAQVTARQRRRDRNGRCKPGGWRQGWKPARAETASLAPFTTARPARGTPGKGISRRTTKQTVMRASEKRRAVAVAVAVAVAGTTTSSVTGK